MISFADFSPDDRPCSVKALQKAKGPEEALELAAQALEKALAAGSKERQAAALVASGEASVWSGDFGTAVARASEALELCTSLGEKRGQGCALYLLATSRKAQGHTAPALQAATRAAAVFKGLGDKAWETKSLEAVAAVLLAKDGQLCLSRAAEVLRGLARQHAAATFNRTEADVMLAKGELNVAVRLAAEACHVERSLVGSSHGRMALLPPVILPVAEARRAAVAVLKQHVASFSKAALVDVLLAVAAAELSDGLYKEVLQTASEALELCRTQVKNPKGEAFALRLLSLLRLPSRNGGSSLDRAAEGLQFAEEAVALFRTPETLAGHACALLHRPEGKKDAVRTAEEAVAMAEQRPDGNHSSALAEALGAKICALFEGGYETASTKGRCSAFEEASKACRKLRTACKDRGSLEALAVEMAACVSVLLGQEKDGVRSCKEAIQLFKRSDDQEGAAVAESTLVTCCFARRDFDQALQLAKAAAARSRQLKDMKAAAIASLVAGCAHLGNEDAALAVSAAEDALNQILPAVADGAVTMAAYRLMHDAHRASGKPMSAQKAARDLHQAVRAGGSPTASDEAWAFVQLADALGSEKDGVQAAKDALAILQSQKPQASPSLEYDRNVFISVATLAVARAVLGRESSGGLNLAIESALGARTAFQTLGRSEALEALALTTVAMGWSLLGDTDAAEKVGRDALKLFQDLGDITASTLVSNLISKVLMVPHVGSSARLVADVENGVAYIDVNERVGLEALQEAMHGLQRAQVRSNSAIKVIVLQIEGSPRDTALNTHAPKIGSFLLALRTLGLPLITASWGKIAGPNWGLLLAADYRIAANTATFVLPIWGLPESMGVLLGHNVATQLNFDSGPVGAINMLEMGLIHQCCRGRDEVLQAASELGKRIAGTPSMACRQMMKMMHPAVEKYAIAAATGLIRA